MGLRSEEPTSNPSPPSHPRAPSRSGPPRQKDPFLGLQVSCRMWEIPIELELFDPGQLLAQPLVHGEPAKFHWSGDESSDATHLDFGRAIGDVMVASVWAGRKANTMSFYFISCIRHISSFSLWALTLYIVRSSKSLQTSLQPAWRHILLSSRGAVVSISFGGSF